jgi:hypothetical protein
MTNIRKSASETAKEKKLLLFPGDPLIKILKPDHYVVVDPGTFAPEETGNLADGSDGSEDPEVPDPPLPPEDSYEPPNLEDITLVSKKLVTDKNKNQYIEFVFNVKNHVGDSVVGVNAYGQ